jgi:hypothetical protein
MVDKLLAKIKGFGHASLGPTLGILGSRLVIVEDPEMTAQPWRAESQAASNPHFTGGLSHGPFRPHDQ